MKIKSLLFLTLLVFFQRVIICPNLMTVLITGGRLGLTPKNNIDGRNGHCAISDGESGQGGPVSINARADAKRTASRRGDSVLRASFWFLGLL